MQLKGLGCAYYMLEATSAAMPAIADRPNRQLSCWLAPLRNNSAAYLSVVMVVCQMISVPAVSGTKRADKDCNHSGQGGQGGHSHSNQRTGAVCLLLECLTIPFHPIPSHPTMLCTHETAGTGSLCLGCLPFSATASHQRTN